MDLDLDIINKKQHTIKIFGKKVAFKDVTIKEHLHNEFIIQELDKLPLVDEESIEKAMDIISEYLVGILELEEDDARLVTMEQYKAIRRFLERKDMYDQGFSDREIDAMEKKAAKKIIAQA